MTDTSPDSPADSVRTLTDLPADTVRTTCDATALGPDTSDGRPLFGPCILRHGHAGPVHEDDTGTRWADTTHTVRTGADSPETCRVCGTTERLFWRGVGSGLPYCADCEACDCGQEPCVRAGINALVVSKPARLRERYAEAIESEIYEYRERTMLWGETEGVTEEIARLAARGALEVRDEEVEQLSRRVRMLEHVAKGNLRHVQRIAPDLDKAEAALDRVRGLHHDDGYGGCYHCTVAYLVPWPCPTITTLDAPPADTTQERS